MSRLACLLAEVRNNDGQRLAWRLSEPVLSALRFQRLMRAHDKELPGALRRAIVMADRRGNLAALGSDLLRWGDAVKTRWCFDYYGEQAPEVNPDTANSGAKA